MTSDATPIGSRVKVRANGHREHGRSATVLHYNPDTRRYFVQFDEGKPWCGRHKQKELEVVE